MIIYLHKYKNVFRDEEDIKDFINFQYLGSLPKFKKNEISEIKNTNDLKNFLKDKKSKFFIFKNQ